MLLLHLGYTTCQVPAELARVTCNIFVGLVWARPHNDGLRFFSKSLLHFKKSEGQGGSFGGRGRDEEVPMHGKTCVVAQVNPRGRSIIGYLLPLGTRYRLKINCKYQGCVHSNNGNTTTPDVIIFKRFAQLNAVPSPGGSLGRP